MWFFGKVHSFVPHVFWSFGLLQLWAWSCTCTKLGVIGHLPFEWCPPVSIARYRAPRWYCPRAVPGTVRPNGEITEAHILTDPLIFDHSDYNVSSHSVSTAGATGDVQYSQVS